MKKITRTQLRIPNHLYAEIRKASKEKGVSMNSFIVECLASYFNEKAPSPTKAEEALELISKALRIKNHDHYNNQS